MNADLDALYQTPEFNAYLSVAHIFMKQTTDWRVGWDLWQQFTDGMKQNIIDIRKKARAAEDLGGKWTHKRGIPNNGSPQLLPL